MKYWWLVCFLGISMISFAEIRLPVIFQDGMVLQRAQNVKIWGWANPSEPVEMLFRQESYQTIANSQGRWEIVLPPIKVGGPYSIYLKGENSIQINDILVGDVWLCSGQSNMEHKIALHDVTYAKEIRQANFPAIRQFFIPNSANLKEPSSQGSTLSKWQTAVGENIRSFSAVAYFFAKKIYEETKVPIGIINASVGGSPIEAWISENGFSAFQNIRTLIDKNKENVHVQKNLNEEKSEPVSDQGLLDSVKWFELAYKPKNWRTINIPGYWNDQGIKQLNGIVWYRRQIKVPDSFLKGQATVFLGRIVDADELYINGHKVGNTGYQYPQRRYHIPAGVLKEGENLFVIRVTNNSGKGGFVPDKPYAIIGEKDTIDLKGYWQYKVGAVFLPGQFKDSFMTLPQNQPTALYNGMIAPIKEYAIKGVLWYQGESNTGNPEMYRKLFPALINDWRNQFQHNNLPFIYVQLPGFMEYNYLPSESNWAFLRDVQLNCLSIPNTAMVVGIDAGEWNDIHPENKAIIGRRAALSALGSVYGKPIVYSGPIIKDALIEDDKIVVSFNHIGSGLIAKDGQPLSDFAIAGINKKFVWANAIIKNNKIVIWNENVRDPKYVRYAWADNPINPNLYNQEGLPASPFKTDK